jgi:hypothetical protein
MMCKQLLLALLIKAYVLITVSANAQTVQENKPEADARFVLATLRIEKKGTGLYDIKLLKSVLLNGHYKNNEPGRSAGDFICTVTNDQNIPLQKILIKDPLNIRYEYPDEEGRIGVKTVQKSEGEVLLRFNYIEGMKFLSIGKLDENGILTPVTTLPLIF